MKTYHAEVCPDGKFWYIRVPEINRSTQALRFKDIRMMAGELIEIMDEVDSGDYALEVNVQLPAGVREHLAQAERLREEAKEKVSKAAEESRAAVRTLLSTGMSRRDAGSVLGLSFQRISQLAKPR